MSNGPEFFQTVMGHKFYEADVPRVAKALERIASALEKRNEDPDDPVNVAEYREKQDAPAPIEPAIQKRARAQAKRTYEKEGSIEFDDDATVSVSLDHDGNVQGAYVAAWVWVEFTANQKKGDE